MVKPRFSLVPSGNGRLGDEAVELCSRAGLELDGWQAHVLRSSLRRRRGGLWSATTVGVNVPRQNGKGGIVEARILAELYLVRSELTIYSAHNFDTALEHFRRVAWLIEDSAELSSELIGRKGSRPYGITWGKGSEGIELQGNRRLQIRTRTAGGGRGFSADCLILDEAMFLPEFTVAALRPVVSARENPQVWYLGSAVDQQTHENGVAFARVRENGIGGDDPRLAYFEWSVEGDAPDAVPAEVLRDRAAWAQANPALGIRIGAEALEDELREMGPRAFAVERLGVGDWPRTDHVLESAISLVAWERLADQKSELQDPVCFAFDVSPERRGSISAAGKNGEGLWHVEVVEDKPHTDWMVARLKELVGAHNPVAVVCDGYGPGASLVAQLEDENVEVTTVNGQEYAQGCARLVDAVNEEALRHRGDPRLANAIRAASTRPLGEAWAWSRRNSSANISPLVSATLALSAAQTAPTDGKVLAWL